MWIKEDVVDVPHFQYTTDDILGALFVFVLLSTLITCCAMRAR